MGTSVSVVLNVNSFQTVNTFADLPSAGLYTNKSIVVLTTTGTRYLPGSLGGTFRPKGLYYSNGTSWDYKGEVPYQATQSEVDAGTVNDTFVTPNTFNNASKWNTKANVSHTHTASQITDFASAVASLIPPLTYSSVTVNNTQSTTSTAFVAMSGLDITPAAGTYIFILNAQSSLAVAGTDNATEIGLFLGGIIITNSNRESRITASGLSLASLGINNSIVTIGTFTVNGSQIIQGGFRRSGASTATITARNLTLIKVG